MSGTLAFLISITMIVLASSVLRSKMRLEGAITRADGLLVTVGALGIVLAVGLAWLSMAGAA